MQDILYFFKNQIQSQNQQLIFSAGMTDLINLSRLCTRVPGQQLTIKIDTPPSIDANNVLQISGTPEIDWLIMSVKSAKITGSTIRISISQSADAYQICCRGKGQCALGENVSIPVLFSLVEDTDIWKIDLPPQSDLASQFENFIPLMTVQEVLPEALDALKSFNLFSIDKLESVFYPNGKDIAYTKIAIAPNDAAAAWSILNTSHSIKDLKLDLSHYYLFPDDGSYALSTGEISATLQIGNSEVKIVLAMVFDREQDWEFDIQPGTAIPTFDDLNGFFVGGEDLLEQLPTGHGGTTDLRISDIKIGFRPRELMLDYITLNIDQSGQWVLNKDYITVQDVSIFGTVLDPLNQGGNWGFSAGVDGNVNIGGATIGISAHIPELELRGVFLDKEPVKLESVLEHFKVPANALTIFKENAQDSCGAPQALTDIAIAELDLYAKFKPNELKFCALVHLEELLTLNNLIPNVAFTFESLLLRIGFDETAEQKMTGEVDASFSLSFLDPSSQGQQPADDDETSDSNTLFFDADFKLDETSSFAASAQNVNLSEILEKLLGIDHLPEGVPDVIIEQLDFTIDSKKQYSLSATVQLDDEESVHPENKGKTLQLGDKQVNLASLDFGFSNDECHVTIKGQNIPTIKGVDIELRSFEFSFKYTHSETEKKWVLLGTVQASIFNCHDLSLSASYKDISVQGTKKQCFALAYDTKAETPKAQDPSPETESPIPADQGKAPKIEIPNLISLEVTRIDLGIERKKSGEETDTDWHISTDSTLKIKDLLNGGKTLLDIKGELLFEHETTQRVTSSKLKFGPIPDAQGKQDATLSLPLAVFISGEGNNPSLDFTFEEIEIASQKTGEEPRTWDFRAASSLTLREIPDKLSDIINSSKIKVSSTLKINTDGIDFSVSNSIPCAEFDYPILKIPAIANPIDQSSGGDSSDIDLGTGAIGIGSLDFKMSSDDASMSIALKLGLPSEFNKVIGKALHLGDDFKILKVYNPDQQNPDASTIDLKLSFGVKTGFSAVLSSSPFNFVSLEDKRSYDEKRNFTHVPDSNKYIYVDLEKLKIQASGQVEIEVPKFSIDTSKGALSASGGFQIIKEVQIPTVLLKNLLKYSNVPEKSIKKLPDPIPLKGYDFFDDNGKFEMDKCTAQFQDITGVELPNEVQTLFAFIVENMLDELPKRLTPYLNLSFPTGFNFDIAITSDGGCKLNLSGHGDKKASPAGSDKSASDKCVEPVRILYPALNGYLPTLYGIEFRSFSFGELLSGAFLLVEADMKLDQFDILSTIIDTLVYDLAKLDDKDLDALQHKVSDELRAKLNAKQLKAVTELQKTSDDVLKALSKVAKTAKKFLADPTTLHNTFVVEKLFMLVIYETEFPIPIPLFYDKLGFEVTDILGFTVQSHIGLPAPRLNLMEIVKTAMNFKTFVTVKDYELPLKGDGVPTNIDLEFRGDNNYFELPKFLGGKILLGAEGPNFDISLYKTIAGFLNAVKKISLDKTIRAIPYKDRSGTQDFVFGPFSLETAYLLSTGDEISDNQYINDPDYIALANKPSILGVSDVLTLAGYNGDVGLKDKYIVLFLSGKFGLADLLKVDAMFGIIATAKREFVTGFQFDGSLDGLLALNISAAAFLLKPSSDAGLKSTTFQIAGQTKLKLLTKQIFHAHGVIRADSDSFYMEGDVTFNSLPDTIAINTTCEGSLQFNKTGAFKLTFDADASLQLHGLELAKGNEQFYLELSDKGLNLFMNTYFECLSNTFTMRGMLVIQKTGMQGSVVLSLDTDNTVNLFGFKLPILGDDYVEFHVEPENAGLKFSNELSIPPLFDKASVTGQLDTAGNGALNIHVPKGISINGAGLSGDFSLVVTPKTASIQLENAVLTYWSKQIMSTNVTISNKGYFSLQATTKAQIGTDLLYVTVPDICMENSEEKCAIALTNSELKSKFFLNLNHSLTVTKGDLPIEITIDDLAFDLGILKFSGGEYKLTIRTDKSVELKLTKDAECHIGLGATSKLNVSALCIDTKTATLTGKMNGDLKLGTYTICDDNFKLSLVTLKQNKKLMKIHGGSKTNLGFAKVDMTGDLTSDGKFTFTGTFNETISLTLYRYDGEIKMTLSDSGNKAHLAGIATGAIDYLKTTTKWKTKRKGLLKIPYPVITTKWKHLCDCPRASVNSNGEFSVKVSGTKIKFKV